MSPFRDHARESPHCRCGHARDHPLVSADPEYSWVGWFFILVGVSWDPAAIAFVCRRCSESIERIVDPQEVAAARLAG